jgi:hypothetical protein
MKYIVNRDMGFPITEGVDAYVAVANGKIKHFKLGETFESDQENGPTTAECEKAVGRGYLMRAIGVTNGDGESTEIMSSAPPADASKFVSGTIAETHDASEAALDSFTKEEKASLKK